MKKKKVLFLIESFIVGGAEKVLIDIVNHLNPDKYDITVCSVFKHSVYKGYDKTFEKPFKEHIKYKYLINNKYHWLYLIFNFLLARFPNIIYQLFIGDKYDTVIAFYEGLPTYWISNAKLKKGKKIAWLHTTTALSQNTKNQNEINTEKYIYSQYNQIIAVSQSVAESFKRLFQLIEVPIIIQYNPININHIRQNISLSYPIKDNKFTFISVGRITEVKGYDRILRVANKLKDKGYSFQWWIIGGGDISNLQNYIENYSLNDIVLFLGHQDNPYPFIYQADCFVSASYTEGLGMSLIEALALEKAVLCSNYDAAKEILENDKYGMIFEQSDEDFFRKIEKIFQHPEILSSYQIKGLERANFFSLENQIKNIENII